MYIYMAKSKISYKKRFRKYRKGKKMVIYKTPKMKYFKFQRNCSLSTIGATHDASATHFVRSFKITDVPNYSEFLNLFDCYKIQKIDIYFIPESNVTLSVGNNEGILFNSPFSSRMHTVIDYNDKNTPTSTNEMREYSTHYWTPYNKIHKRTFRPKPLVVMDEDGPSGNSVGMGNAVGNPWVSTGSNQTEWFGLKGSFQYPTAISTGDYYTVEAKYYMIFKNYN